MENEHDLPQKPLGQSSARRCSLLSILATRATIVSLVSPWIPLIGLLRKNNGISIRRKDVAMHIILMFRLNNGEMHLSDYSILKMWTKNSATAKATFTSQTNVGQLVLVNDCPFFIHTSNVSWSSQKGWRKSY